MYNYRKKCKQKILWFLELAFVGLGILYLLRFTLCFQKMVNGRTVDRWTCLSFSRMVHHDVVRICYDLVQMCKSIGMVSSCICFWIQVGYNFVSRSTLNFLCQWNSGFQCNTSDRSSVSFSQQHRSCSKECSH